MAKRLFGVESTLFQPSFDVVSRESTMNLHQFMSFIAQRRVVSYCYIEGNWARAAKVQIKVSQTPLAETYRQTFKRENGHVETHLQDDNTGECPDVDVYVATGKTATEIYNYWLSSHSHK